MRPRPLHREKHPLLDQPNCFGCKAASISFGTVPGGSRDSKNGVSNAMQREKDLHRYREKRRAGEQPDGTTKKAMDKYDRRIGSWEKRESWFRDDNPPERFEKLKQRTFNK